MSGRLDELAAVLAEELELTGKLLDLAKDARAAVISADPELLAGIVAEQEECSARLEVAEARRVEMALALGAELGLSAPNAPTLKAIVERAPRESGLRLRSLGQRLKSTATQLRRVGERNALLIRESVEHVDGFFAALARTCRDSAGYRPDGQEKSGRSAAVLDQQA